MGEITTRGRDGAEWLEPAAEGTYRASVERFEPVDYEGAGVVLWAWHLAFTPAERFSRQGFECVSGDDDVIRDYLDHEPAEILGTLASFMSAWDKSLTYPGGGENVDLFPHECEPFLGASEDFYLDTHEAEFSAE